MNWREATDWFWPTLEPPSMEYAAAMKARVEEDIAARNAACAGSSAQALQWLQHEMEEYRREEARGERARTFLQQMFASGGVAAAAASGLTAWLAPGKVSGLTPASVTAFIGLGAYASMQLIGVLVCAVRGLRVRGFEALPHPEPLATESSEAYDRRKAAEIQRVNAFNAEQVNEYVSWKKVALVCWRNFACALGAILLGTVIATYCNSP